MSFLSNFFDQYVQPTFTASLEDKLDGVAAGTTGTGRRCYASSGSLSRGTVGEVKERRTAELIDALNEALGAQALPTARGWQ